MSTQAWFGIGVIYVLVWFACAVLTARKFAKDARCTRRRDYSHSQCRDYGHHPDCWKVTPVNETDMAKASGLSLLWPVILPVATVGFAIFGAVYYSGKAMIRLANYERKPVAGG